MPKLMHVTVWDEYDPLDSYTVYFQVPHELADDPREVQRFASAAVLDAAGISYSEPREGPAPVDGVED